MLDNGNNITESTIKACRAAGGIMNADGDVSTEIPIYSLGLSQRRVVLKVALALIAPVLINKSLSARPGAWQSTSRIFGKPVNGTTL